MASNALDSLSADKHELLSLVLKEAGLARQERIPRRQALATPPLSFAQQRLWFLDQLEPGNPQYNTPTGARLLGPLDVGVLTRALEEIVRRHEILRTVFPTIDNRPVQKILPPFELPVPVVDLSDIPELARTLKAREIIDLEGARPFDLSTPLLRVVLLRLATNEHWLLIMTHHMVFDGWSVGVFAEELATLYNAFADNKPSPLRELPIQYADFAMWQRQRLQGKFLREQIEYWKEKLDGAPEVLRMPTDRPRPPVQRFRGRIQNFSLPATLTRSLNDLGRMEKTTLFVVLMAAFQTLLYRYSGQEDMVVSAGTANRNRTEVAPLIGCFINILLLRTDLSGDPTFVDLLHRVHDSALEAHAHQDLPFERLVSVLRPRRDLSYSPLAQVMMVLHNAPMPPLDFHGLRLSRIPTAEKMAAQYDLLIHFTETENGLVGRLEYNTNLYDPATIDRLLRNFEALLHSAAANPGQRISTLRILTEEERRIVLTGNNTTSSEFPMERCLHELFQDQLGRRPEASAVIMGDEMITYRELNARSNELAQRLQAAGVGLEVAVGVCMFRSVELVIALLAVLKAGGAYLPLDPDYPSERLGLMMEDSGVRVLLTTRGLSAHLPSHNAQVITIDRKSKCVEANFSGNRQSQVRPDNLVYVIYTSGSTGKPKAVMLDHRGRVNNFFDFNQRFQVGPQDRVLALSSPSFDMCAYDVFGTLAAGATIVMPETSRERDPKHWAEVMVRNRVTVWHSVPALLELLLGGLAAQPALASGLALRLVLLGGDWIPVTLPDRIRKVVPGAEVVSLGGATEVSMDSTIYRIDVTEPAWTGIPYGKAMANQLAYVLDTGLQAVPIGVYGELYLGGVGVGRGYHNRPELTAERFLPNPFSNIPGDRIYKTGDVARYKADGNLELLGRIDQQVKIRGFRIELGEVKSALERHPAVNEAEVLIAGNSAEDKRLVAYIVPRGAAPSTADVQAFLRTVLPAYMVPNACVVLDRMPLSPNGKVDRRALPATGLSRPSTDQSRSAPRDGAEREIHRIWTRVLRTDDIGVDDDFFELGGDSFQAITMLQQLPKSLALVDFLRRPTIRGVAQCCSTVEIHSSSLLVPLTKHARSDVPALVCIPYGGGSAIVYQALARALSGKMDVRAAMLPGHDFDGRQELSLSIEALAKACANEIEREIRTPVYLYGHCAGSALTIEIARLLDEGGKLEGVFIGGAYPWYANKTIRVLRRFKLARTLESNRDIVNYIQSLGGIADNFAVANVEFVANAFRQDGRLAEQYFKQHALGWSRRLAAPLVCVFAEDDPVTRNYREAFRKWELFATSVELVLLPSGGHYFVKQKAGEVARLILAKCKSMPPEYVVEAYIA